MPGDQALIEKIRSLSPQRATRNSEFEHSDALVSKHRAGRK